MPRSALSKPPHAQPTGLPDAAAAHALREQRFTPAKLASSRHRTVFLRVKLILVPADFAKCGPLLRGMLGL